MIILIELHTWFTLKYSFYDLISSVLGANVYFR